MELVRYGQKNGFYFVERHVLREDAAGFDVSGTNYVVVAAINPMYDSGADPLVHPHTHALSTGVTEKTQAEYDTGVAADKAAYQTETQGSNAQKLADKEAKRIRLIDYHGRSFKVSGSKKREWFNDKYGFDPVDDDPRT